MGKGGVKMKHDKISFAREYCLCRRIPYRIKGEALFINGYQVCFSLYNLDYSDILKMIDTAVIYDKYGRYENSAK